MHRTDWRSAVWEQSERGRCLTWAGNKWAFESALVKKGESGKCETNGGWRATPPANGSERDYYPLVFSLFSNAWTHLFPARTLPGPRHHSDIRPMLPRYRRNSAAEVERRERMGCLTSNTPENVSGVCIEAHFICWLLLLRTNWTDFCLAGALAQRNSSF